MDFSRLNLSSYLPAMPYAVRELFDKATNMVMNYSETEAKVVEATNDESWGPPGKLLQDLSQLSYASEHYNEIMGMLWKRCFTQDKRYWRRTYKSLLVLTYLIKSGNEKVIVSIREHLFDLKSLENFIYRDENNKDQGINIRHKVKELVAFVQDDDRIRIERKQAKANRDKYVGMSNEVSPYLNDESNSSKTRDLSDEDNQNFQFTPKSQSDSFEMIENFNLTIEEKETSRSSDVDSSLTPSMKKSEVVVSQAPIVDLLGDEVDYAVKDVEFGQFQEAISPTSPIQSSSPDFFDPFASFETSTTNLFPSNNQTQPITPSVNQPSNTWSFAQGKLDISLNNLIPHTRGETQKNSLPLNQLSSPTNSSSSHPPSVFSNLNRK